MMIVVANAATNAVDVHVLVRVHAHVHHAIVRRVVDRVHVHAVDRVHDHDLVKEVNNVVRLCLGQRVDRILDQDQNQLLAKQLKRRLKQILIIMILA